MKYLRALEFFLPFQKIMNCFEEQGPTLIGKSILPESFFHHYKNTNVNMLRTGKYKHLSKTYLQQL